MNLPVPVTTQMSWGMAEQDRAARTAAAISGFDSELQRMEQSEAELIQDLTDLQQRIKEVRGKHADAGRALADAQKNVRISHDMVKSWCVANEVPVPDFPELTQPFHVPPASAPVRIVADLRQGVTYADRDGWIWRWTGAHAQGQPDRPVMQELDGEQMLAELVIRDRGPLVVTAEPVDFSDGAPPDRLTDLSASRPAEPGEAATS